MSFDLPKVYRDVVKWNLVADRNLPETFRPLKGGERIQAWSLIAEEYNEFLIAEYKYQEDPRALIEIADALGDMVVVVLGYAAACGVSKFDLDDEFPAVYYNEFGEYLSGLLLTNDQQTIEVYIEDMLSYILGTALDYSLDLQRICEEVMRSNWTKFVCQSDGQTISESAALEAGSQGFTLHQKSVEGKLYFVAKDEFGKVRKLPNFYKEPDLSFVLEQYSEDSNL